MESYLWMFDWLPDEGDWLLMVCLVHRCCIPGATMDQRAGPSLF